MWLTTFEEACRSYWKAFVLTPSTSGPASATGHDSDAIYGNRLGEHAIKSKSVVFPKLPAENRTVTDDFIHNLMKAYSPCLILRNFVLDDGIIRFTHETLKTPLIELDYPINTDIILICNNNIRLIMLPKDETFKAACAERMSTAEVWVRHLAGRSGTGVRKYIVPLSEKKRRYKALFDAKTENFDKEFFRSMLKENLNKDVDMTMAYKIVGVPGKLTDSLVTPINGFPEWTAQLLVGVYFCRFMPRSIVVNMGTDVVNLDTFCTEAFHLEKGDDDGYAFVLNDEMIASMFEDRRRMQSYITKRAFNTISPPWYDVNSRTHSNGLIQPYEKSIQVINVANSLRRSGMLVYENFRFFEPVHASILNCTNIGSKRKTAECNESTCFNLEYLCYSSKYGFTLVRESTAPSTAGRRAMRRKLSTVQKTFDKTEALIQIIAGEYVPLYFRRVLVLPYAPTWCKDKTFIAEAEQFHIHVACSFDTLVSPSISKANIDSGSEPIYVKAMCALVLSQSEFAEKWLLKRDKLLQLRRRRESTKDLAVLSQKSHVATGAGGLGAAYTLPLIGAKMIAEHVVPDASASLRDIPNDGIVVLLTPEQKYVSCGSNHQVISGSAGAGRTTVLVSRVFEILKNTRESIELIVCSTAASNENIRSRRWGKTTATFVKPVELYTMFEEALLFQHLEKLGITKNLQPYQQQQAVTKVCELIRNKNLLTEMSTTVESTKQLNDFTNCFFFVDGAIEHSELSPQQKICLQTCFAWAVSQKQFYGFWVMCDSHSPNYIDCAANIFAAANIPICELNFSNRLGTSNVTDVLKSTHFFDVVGPGKCYETVVHTLSQTIQSSLNDYLHKLTGDGTNLGLAAVLINCIEPPVSKEDLCRYLTALGIITRSLDDNGAEHDDKLAVGYVDECHSFEWAVVVYITNDTLDLASYHDYIATTRHTCKLVVIRVSSMGSGSQTSDSSNSASDCEVVTRTEESIHVVSAKHGSDPLTIDISLD